MEHPPSNIAPLGSSPSPPLQWSPRSNISLFIHALHLLDLDLHPTWPNITESTYTTTKPTQNLQARVKSTEWSLYHLVNLYSPSETRSKLSASFPAVTPIQSKNLRAGLYKWLTELKANGVLPREVVLRKTMLDECRGEKFEEVLARFAMVVLRKTLGKDKQGREVQEQNMDNLVPLIVSYRSALQQSLGQRKELETKATAFSEQLARLRTDVDTQLGEMQSLSSVEGNAKPLTVNEIDALHDQVDLAFANDRRWARFIFKGKPCPSDGERKMHTWPFDIDNNTPDPEPLATENGKEAVNEPVFQLQALISEHQQRLQRLTRLRDSFLPTLASNIPRTEQIEHPPANKTATSQPHKSRFNRHQELTLEL